MSPTERRWPCPTCGQGQPGPLSPCPNPACLAEDIRREATWKRYDDE